MFCVFLGVLIQPCLRPACLFFFSLFFFPAVGLFVNGRLCRTGDGSIQPKNMIVVKSPRSRETLDRLLGHTNCVLAAEHGAFIRWGKHARWQVCLCVSRCVCVDVWLCEEYVTDAVAP